MLSLILSLHVAMAEPSLDQELIPTSSVQEESKNLFLGIGVGLSPDAPFLHMTSQFRPQVKAMVQPYADARVQMAFGPDDATRNILASILESGTAEEIQPNELDLSWNTFNIQSHFGVEVQGPRSLFLRTGPALSYDSTPGMYESLSTKYMIAVDLTSTLRVGGFVTTGADITLKDTVWTPSLTIAHVQGVNTGGGALRDTMSGLDIEANNASMGTNFTHASYANHMSYIQMDHHIKRDSLSFHIGVQAGKTHASDVTTYLIEEEGLEDPYNREILQLNLAIGSVF